MDQMWQHVEFEVVRHMLGCMCHPNFSYAGDSPHIRHMTTCPWLDALPSIWWNANVGVLVYFFFNSSLACHTPSPIPISPLSHWRWRQRCHHHFSVGRAHFPWIRLFFSISCVYFSDASFLWAMIISFSNHFFCRLVWNFYRYRCDTTTATATAFIATYHFNYSVCPCFCIMQIADCAGKICTHFIHLTALKKASNERTNEKNSNIKTSGNHLPCWYRVNRFNIRILFHVRCRHIFRIVNIFRVI